MSSSKYKVKPGEIKLRRSDRYTPAELEFAEKFGFDRMKDVYRITWGDAVDKGHSMTLEPLIRQMAILAAEGNKIIVWRTIFPDHKAEFSVRRDLSAFDPQHPDTRRVRAYYENTAAMFKTQGDLNPKVLDLIRANGMLALHWGDGLFDNFAPPWMLFGGLATPFMWESRLQHDRPGICRVDRFGHPHYGVWEYRYPEAREYAIKRFLWEMQSYDFDGMLISTRSHSVPALDGEQFGYNDVTDAELQRRAGVSFREAAYWRRPDVQETRRRILGEAATLFLRDLRAVWPKGKKLYIGIPRAEYFGPPYGNIFIDWRTWLNEKLVDGLYLGEISGKALYYPAITNAEYRNYIADEEAGIGLRPYLYDLNCIYGPACKAAGAELFVNRDSASIKQEMFGGQYMPNLERGRQE